MTTSVLDVPDSGSVTTEVQRRTALRNPFFSVMSSVTLLIVVSGFTPTLYLRPAFNPPPIPWYLFLHGAALTSWFVWLFVQTLLIQSRRTALHRRLGVAGAVLAAAIPFLALMASAGVPRRIVSLGIDMDADASVLTGIGVSGITVVQFVAGVVWGNLSSALSFALLAWTGILLRRRPAAHKRLMLLATIAIVGPALARLSRLPIFGASEEGPFTPIVVLTLLGAVIAHDVVTTRRIHPATIFGVLFPLGSFFLFNQIAATNTGMGLVRWLQ
jgi:hypothetical protein